MYFTVYVTMMYINTCQPLLSDTHQLALMTVLDSCFANGTESFLLPVFEK